MALLPVTLAPFIRDTVSGAARHHCRGWLAVAAAHMGQPPHLQCLDQALGDLTATKNPPRRSPSDDYLARIMAMETLSITEAKNRFTELADRAAAEHDHFTVTRNGHPHVMVVSVAEWDQLQETIAVLSDPEVRADLAESAEAAMRGDFTTEDEMQAILDARLGRKTGR
jgi:antitoxin YefM